MKGFVGGYYRFSVWITNFAYLNLLWVVFTIAGLGLFGLFPATAAMFSVVRRWLRKEEFPIFQTFWRYFRKEFVKTNLLGLIFLLIGYFLFIELQILWGSQKMVYFVASFGVIGLFIVYAIMLLYFFPIYVHFNLTKREYFKWPFIIGILHPILTVFLGIAILLLHYFTFMTIPALLFFFGGSVTAYVIMWGAAKTFPKYEAETEAESVSV